MSENATTLDAPPSAATTIFGRHRNPLRRKGILRQKIRPASHAHARTRAGHKPAPHVKPNLPVARARANHETLPLSSLKIPAVSTSNWHTLCRKASILSNLSNLLMIAAPRLPKCLA